MFCFKCGTQLPDDAAFCFNCGTKIEKIIEETVQQPEELVQEAPQEQLEEIIEPVIESLETVEPGVEIVESNVEIIDAAAKPVKFHMTKKKLAIIAAAAVAVLVIVLIICIPSKFKRVKNECVHIAGMASTGKNYFELDTLPDAYDNMDETLKMILLPQAQENALEAIKYANEELGFNGSVYSQMMETSAIMGRQSVENDKYRVSWTYHPDDGLEVTYEKK